MPGLGASSDWGGGLQPAARATLPEGLRSAVSPSGAGSAGRWGASCLLEVLLTLSSACSVGVRHNVKS